MVVAGFLAAVCPLVMSRVCVGGAAAADQGGNLERVAASCEYWR